jgi:phosphatidylglycerophosphate synthase
MYFLFRKNKLFQESIKLRPVEEFININLYRPLAFLVLLMLIKLNIDTKPEIIVVFHTFLIILASFLILFENNFINFVVFFLINLKIVLDNLDGQYSRIKKMESELGRYLDTIMDFLGNFTLFLAIGIKYNNLILAILAFFLFTIILSYDFNLEYLYRNIRNEQFRPNIKDNPNFILNFLKGMYNFFLNPQDKFIRYIENKAFQFFFSLIKRYKFNKFNAYINDLELENNLKRIFWSNNYLHITANMGLSTQLFILSLMILFNLEFYFFYFIFFEFLFLILVFFIRILIIFFYGLLIKN